jgi:uncharacterized repeat protein (TIGR03803 family)
MIGIGVTNIGAGPFIGCTGLAAILVDTNTPAFCSVGGVLFNLTQTALIEFPPSSAIGNYTIPDSVTSIGDEAFDGCTSLTNITIPDSVTNIGNSTFAYCSNLTSIAIPNSVSSIGNEAFFSCTGLTNLTFGTNIASIGNSAFYDCLMLISANFHGNAPHNVGSAVFGGDSKATIYFPLQATGWGASFGGCPTKWWNPIGPQNFYSFGSSTMQIICAFNGTNGNGPSALTLGNDGNFYGTTSSGGIASTQSQQGMGTIFEATTNGQLTVINYFTYTNGMFPGGLTLGGDGCFYGTTGSGGSSNLGTIFKVTTNGLLNSLWSFKGGCCDGSYPNDLTLGSDGNFYGTTQTGGGSDNEGTIFEVKTNGNYVYLDSFASDVTPAIGAYPASAPTLGSDGNLYGETDNSIYELFSSDVSCSCAFKELSSPFLYWGQKSALCLGSDGNFYGTAKTGAVSFDDGELYKITPSGAFTLLVKFAFTNGLYPTIKLIQGSDGFFYGSTSLGGLTNSVFTNGMGTIFRVTTNGVLTPLTYFASSSLTAGPDGNLYGTTVAGDNYPFGAVFKLLLPPFISLQPQSQICPVGNTVSFEVGASSLTSLSYQWQKGGTNLYNNSHFSGANLNSLTISNVAYDDAGNYAVIVSNTYTNLTSTNAALTVVGPPELGIKYESGFFEVNISGMLNHTFVLQYCTNLTFPLWINLVSVTNLTTNPYIFSDPSLFEEPVGFYRAYMQ